MDDDERALRQLASERRGSFLAELFAFLREHKKWWLLPIVVTLLLFGALVLLSGTAAGPFIYTLF
jgi:hypothetical protein